MPRDSNGNYVLPSGNPVVSGEVISTSWANPTLSDVAAELTNSLDRSGRGGMLAPFKFLDGTAGAPGMSWTSEPTSGFYRAALSDMRATVAGVGRMRWTGTGCDVWDTAANAGAGAWFSLSGASGLNIALLNAPNQFSATQELIGGVLLSLREAANAKSGYLWHDGTNFRVGTASLSGGITLFTEDVLRATINAAGLTMAAGLGVALTNAGNTAFRTLKMSAADEVVVDTRGGVLHWQNTSLNAGQIQILTTTPAATGQIGTLALVYE